MYANGFEKINFTMQSEIISFAKSLCGKYLAVLFSNSLQIYSLINFNFPKIGEYTRDESSIRSKNSNHWIQWISLETVVIGTQTGHLIFININNNENDNKNTPNIIENVTSIDILDKIITSHSNAFGALVISTPGPYLHFISPSGEILSSLSFASTSLEIPKIIRQIDINETYSIFVFSNGAAAHCKLKEQEVIEKKDILIDFFPMVNEISAVKISNNKNFIIFQTFKGSLIRMFMSTNEITYICEDSSLFHITHDSYHIISLSADGTLIIWSNKTDHLTKTNIKFGQHEIASQMNFISSEIDNYGYRLFCSVSNSKEAYIITFSVTNISKPSLMFCTPTHVIIPPTKVTIYAPTDMLKDGYPLKYISYLPDKKNIAVAGRKYFSLYSNDSGSWRMVKDEKSFCRSIWANESNSSFISVVFNVEESRYYLYMLSSEVLTILDSIKLDGTFIDYDNLGSSFVIATTNSISIFRVMMVNSSVSKMVKLHEFKNLPSFEKVVLLHNFQSVAVLTHEKQLIEFPSNEVLIEGVSSILSCKEDDLFLVVAHGNQFVFYYTEKVLIRLHNKIPASVVDGLSLYEMPCFYEFGKFEFVVDEFLPTVIFHFIENPDLMLKIVKSFASTSSISISVSHAMNLAFKAGKFENFSKMLDMLGDVKMTFLLIALFNVDAEFVSKVKELLPSCDELVEKYPDVAEQIRGIYSTK